MLLRSIVLFISACVFCLGSVAQEFPSKPITVVVPFSAGGPTDTVARNLAQALSKPLKQTVIIENVGGAGGTIGTTKVARAPADGYTLLLMHIGHSTSSALYRNLQFHPINDFEPLGLVVDVPMTLVAKKDLAPNNFKELLAYIKANKDKISYGNAGLGSASHLCGLLLMSSIQTDLTTIPYKGTAPAMNDLVGGQIDLMCDQTTNTTGQIKGGRIKAYGVTSKARIPSLSDIPTLHEQGLNNFEVGVWHGIYAPKGTPKPVLDKLVAALQESLQDPAFRSKMAELGAEIYGSDKARPDALRAHLKAELDKWGPIIKKAGVYAD